MSESDPAGPADEALFPGFRRERIRTREAAIHAVVAVAAAAADRDHRRIACPVLTLWAENKRAEPGWDSVTIWPVSSGHFLPEEAPAETLAALEPFRAQ